MYALSVLVSSNFFFIFTHIILYIVKLLKAKLFNWEDIEVEVKSKSKKSSKNGMHLIFVLSPIIWIRNYKTTTTTTSSNPKRIILYIFLKFFFLCKVKLHCKKEKQRKATQEKVIAKLLLLLYIEKFNSFHFWLFLYEKIFLNYL